MSMYLLAHECPDLGFFSTSRNDCFCLPVGGINGTDLQSKPAASSTDATIFEVRFVTLLKSRTMRT